jgi:hypothetical protein
MKARIGLAASIAVLAGGLVPAAQAQAPAPRTIKMTLREREVPRAFQFHDNDRSGNNSAGDVAQGRVNLVKGRRVIGVVRFKATLTAVNGSMVSLHEEDVATFRRRGRTRGGHLYSVWDHTEDFNRVPRVGDTQRTPIQRGDGRFAGYSGEVVSRCVKVDRRGMPTFIDTITLTKP